jgi:hypothetical protein
MFSVILGLVWPKRRLIVTISTPALISIEAGVPEGVE